MAGGDFSNTIDNGNLTDVYSGNFENEGDYCEILSDELFEFDELNIKFFPNPVVDYLTITELPKQKNNYQVFDINGKLINSFSDKMTLIA